jgi:hypothetical protein
LISHQTRLKLYRRVSQNAERQSGFISYSRSFGRESHVSLFSSPAGIGLLVCWFVLSMGVVGWLVGWLGGWVVADMLGRTHKVSPHDCHVVLGKRRRPCKNATRLQALWSTFGRSRREPCAMAESEERTRRGPRHKLESSASSRMCSEMIIKANPVNRHVSAIK